MINFGDHSLFNDCMQTLKEISIDNDNDQNMTESQLMAVNFDSVKERYVKEEQFFDGVDIKENAIKGVKSVDAILKTKDGRLVFVEFKNGCIKRIKGDIKNKVKDSLLIIGDILNITIGATRKSMDFILVYDESKNPEVQSSRVKIARGISKKAGSEYVFFGMEDLKSIYFRKVYTLTKEEFNNYIKDNVEINAN